MEMQTPPTDQSLLADVVWLQHGGVLIDRIDLMALELEVSQVVWSMMKTLEISLVDFFLGFSVVTDGKLDFIGG